MSDEFSCGCNAGLQITEMRQSLTLEKVGVHDSHSHVVSMMNACKSASGVVGFATHSYFESKGSKGSTFNDKSGWWRSNYFSSCALFLFHYSDTKLGRR